MCRYWTGDRGSPVPREDRLKPVPPSYATESGDGHTGGRGSSGQTHSLRLLMSGGANGGERIRGDLPPLLANGLLYGRLHRLRHLHDIAHESNPLLGIVGPLARGFDFRVEGRLLRAARRHVSLRGRYGGIILAAESLSHASHPCMRSGNRILCEIINIRT